MTFKQALLKAVKADPKRKKLSASLAKIEGRDGLLKKLAWSLMENRVRDELGFTVKDWSKVSAGDWAAILDFLMTILPWLLKLFGL